LSYRIAFSYEKDKYATRGVQSEIKRTKKVL
jgi:hypothetical protein